MSIKTPISYYGGSQKILHHLLRMIPDHHLYAEPFFGGGALYFSKPPSSIEVINDLNDVAITFYRVLQLDFNALRSEISCSLSSRSMHKQARAIIKAPEGHNSVKVAWAFWYCANMSHSAKINGGFSYDRTQNKDALRLIKKIDRFSANLSSRLRKTQIECIDALRVIESRDSEQTFFYLDPPWIGTDQGHYAGYSEDDFRQLLQQIAGIKGKFILSCAPGKLVDQFIHENGWNYLELKKTITAGITNNQKVSSEYLVWNYNLFNSIHNLFRNGN